MNTTTASSIPDPVSVSAKTPAARCAYIYSNGKRCSLPDFSTHSGFCRRHSPDSLPVAIPVPVHNDSEDLSADLLPELSEFSSGIDIRQFLGRLLTLVTKGRISPRRASVLAYITNQLLHSHRAITLESTPAKEKTNIIIDIPRPDRDWPEPETKPRPENPTYADLRS
jgi:hypothetical protein